MDASQQCNTLNFNLGTTAIGTSIGTRSWSIKAKNIYLKIKSGKHFEGNKKNSQVSQYSCSYSNLAPTGCTQYFYDATGTGTVQTYNYNGGIHLANQEQTICIREERAFCRYGMRGENHFCRQSEHFFPQAVHLCR